VAHATTSPGRRSARFPFGLLLVALLGAVYVMTLLPGVGYSGDAAKFQFVGKLLGTPHTTGYPLYLVLNHLFVSWLPLGTLAYKANLLSAVFAVGCALLTQRLLVRLGARPFVAFVTALLAGLTPTLWGQALVAEVYTLNALLVVATLHAFVRWDQTRKRGDLYLAAGIYALSFGNHLTMITLLPAIVLFVWLSDRRVFTRAKTVLTIAGLAALGALQYAYVFWRTYDPATPYLEMATPNLGAFWWYISGAQFKGALFAFSWEELLRNRVRWYGKQLVSEFLIVLPALAVWGAARLPLRHAVLLLGVFLGSAVFALNYDIIDIQAYFIPSFLIVAIAVGLGLEGLWRRVPARAGALAATLCLAVPLALLALGWPRVSQAHNVGDARRVERAIARLGQDAVVVTRHYDTYEYFQYYLLGERQGRRGLSAAYNVPVEKMRHHVQGREGMYLVDERRRVPVGTRLVVVTESDRAALAATGLRLAPLGDALWEVGR
jgi:hypothetical protein